jgi:hypothetical protein
MRGLRGGGNFARRYSSKRNLTTERLAPAPPPILVPSAIATKPLLGPMEHTLNQFGKKSEQPFDAAREL